MEFDKFVIDNLGFDKFEFDKIGLHGNEMNEIERNDILYPAGSTTSWKTLGPVTARC